jgi:mRNA-degrading endonuclease RelE of RelBE toxin-antitoxin system
MPWLGYQPDCAEVMTKDELRELFANADRKGLLDKADSLYKCEDPKKIFKPLTGPLQGYYRIPYGRYRAIYSVDEEILPAGEILIHIKIRFVAAGIRKEGDKKDAISLNNSKS